MKSTIIKFGLLAVALAVLLKLSELAYFLRPNQSELLITITAILLIAFGFILYPAIRKKGKSSKSFTDLQQKYSLSKREVDILNGLVDGMSNKEIGEKYFISESTVKTHVSNILIKLNVKRRTEAIKLVNEYDSGD